LAFPSALGGCCRRLSGDEAEIRKKMATQWRRTREHCAFLLFLLRICYLTLVCRPAAAADPCRQGEFFAHLIVAACQCLAILVNLAEWVGDAELAYVAALVVESVLLAVNNQRLVQANNPLAALTIWHWKERPVECEASSGRLFLLEAYMFNSVLAFYIVLVLRSANANLMVAVCVCLYAGLSQGLGGVPETATAENEAWSGKHLKMPVVTLMFVVVNLGMMLVSKWMFERLQVMLFRQLSSKKEEVIHEKCLRMKAEKTLSDSEDEEPKSIDQESSYDQFTAMQLRTLKKKGYREQWLIETDHVEVTDVVLGKGGYGEVKRGLFLDTPCAIKLPKEDILEGLDSLMNELRVFRHVRHPNIVAFHGACVGAPFPSLAIVMEEVHGCDLVRHMRGRLEETEDEVCGWEEIYILICVCRAVHYLHMCKPQVLHGDLKPSNIHVQRTHRWPVVKLLDFGLSRVMTKSVKPLGGAYRWTAPEVLLKVPPSAAADIFSMGRIMFLLASGDLPFAEMDHKSMQGMVISCAATGKSPTLDWPDDPMTEHYLKVLATKCTEHEPRARPSVARLHQEVQTLTAFWPGYRCDLWPKATRKDASSCCTDTTGYPLEGQTVSSGSFEQQKAASTKSSTSSASDIHRQADSHPRAHSL